MSPPTTQITLTYPTDTNACGRLLRVDDGTLAQQTAYGGANNATIYQGMRYLQWDEDDRLNLVAGDGYLSYYAYGHDGNRAIKMTGNAAIDQTGTLLNSTNLENITIYPNEYLTVTQAEYTKYYYAGGNRIASKIGTGGFEKMTRLCTLDQGPTYNANNLLNFVLYQITNPTNQAQDAVPVETCNGYNINTELLTEPLPTLYITQTNLNFLQANLLQQFRQNLTNSVEPVYYFHSDHLGSASWITNNTGLPVQHLQYLPFGELFANEQSTGYFERFTFTGKEKDIETGYYYFGARFDNVDLGFMSVDPMSDKYPGISPYAYCAWNPVKFIDPTGMDLDIADNDETRNDLLSIVRDKNIDRVKISDGHVSVNTVGLSKDEIENDIGLSLINNMCNSDKKFLFETSDLALICNTNGERYAVPLYKVEDEGLIARGVINASNYGLDSRDTYTYRPKKGYDGQVVIALSGRWFDDNENKNKQSLIFHELAENYYRTHHNQNYNVNGSNMVLGSAHYSAVSLEGNYYGNPNPGGINRYIGFKWSEQIHKKYEAQAKQYLGF